MTARTLRITGSDRVMVLAVHPDDESLATGGLLQRAVHAGAAVRVVFVTDGENNPWPQRVLERRWRVRGEERARWGRRRRREALAALARLGVPAANARFLGWPDQGLTRLLLGAGAGATTAGLVRHVRDWRPTLLFAPSTHDLHPDHNALGVFVGLVRDRLPAGDDSCGGMATFHYRVHGEPPAADAGVTLPLFIWEKHTKRAAIAEHASQLLLSRRRFLAYATDEERFESGEPPFNGSGSPPDSLRIIPSAPFAFEWSLETPLRAFERAELVFVFASSPGMDEVPAWTLPVSRATSMAPVLQAHDRTLLGEATVRVEQRRIFVHLPLSLRPPCRRMFVKLQRRRVFLDASGWREFSSTNDGRRPVQARTVPASALTSKTW